MPQPVDLLVDRHVLVDVGVGLFDVGLGLIVVVVRNEVLDGIVGEQISELLVQLRRERLVVREDERRLLEFLDRPRDGVGLSRAGDAEKRLFFRAGFIARDQLFDRVGLIARRVEGGVDPKRAVQVGAVGL